ncbi:hypothetical protein [Ketogulonicigenium vulgare]|nr:hypothetical protein [Ketogulonicigenium vulgare]ADO43279.1 conserved hypothetical protein [Ketogulonicigenium vulgare Y25]ALJ81686.1 arginine transporter [Ketogulonicigenium vulgare]ANW34358.1 arginine transporter [Ketogulonicigenium vulgare]AOZ55316.1 Arginine/ornithine transport system ATPase [Ketogulonicigenium vulgare]
MQKKTVTTWGLAAILALGLTACGPRGAISEACMTGGRSAANYQLCSCVQNVADQTLSGSEQRRAADFFGEPDRAQAMRTSSSQRDRDFWTRYRAFTNTAASRCG